jgi:hypothetical protein
MLNNLLNPLTATATLALSVAIANPAQAISFNFNWQGNNGYSAKGTFSYNGATAPAIISESGAGSTDYLQSLSVSFFDPANNPLQSYNTVVGGVSNSNFFAFNFDTTTHTLFGNFNVGGGPSTVGTQFFSGNIGGLLRLREIGTNGDILLDSQEPGVIITEKIPEPTSILSLLALGGLSASSLMKKKQKGE